MLLLLLHEHFQQFSRVRWYNDICLIDTFFICNIPAFRKRCTYLHTQALHAYNMKHVKGFKIHNFYKYISVTKTKQDGFEQIFLAPEVGFASQRIFLVEDQ